MPNKNSHSKKQRVVVICPGRGTYNKEELGYLQRYHQSHLKELDDIEHWRRQQQQPSIIALDQQPRYQMSTHTASEHASALIYACALADFHQINQDDYEIVAITGNSMGWYIALALSGVLPGHHGIQLINTMGQLMATSGQGGQLIYPVVDKNWQLDQSKVVAIEKIIQKINQQQLGQVYLSIDLGGYKVLGADHQALKVLQQELPKVDDRYPMVLFNHAAFHTPLLQHIPQLAQQQLNKVLFNQPQIPLINGCGQIWQPYSTNIDELYQYTLHEQIIAPYSFADCIRVALKEFAPDKLILLGPGSSLGGSVGQILIQQQWQGIQQKSDFVQRQTNSPFLLAMGLADQRTLVVK